MKAPWFFNCFKSEVLSSPWFSTTANLLHPYVVAVPCRVMDPGARVVFVPAPHESGDPAAAPPHLYAAFGFTAAKTGTTEFKASEETVAVVVTPVNHAPELASAAVDVAVIKLSEDVAVPLEASDADASDVLTFSVTTLPAVGQLFLPRTTGAAAGGADSSGAEEVWSPTGYISFPFFS